MGAEGVLDLQLAAVVILRLAEEQRGGQIRTHPLDAAFWLTHRVVDMEVETATGGVTVH
ncbi:hypothetical protein D3C81_2120040 [compost metagenome]